MVSNRILFSLAAIAATVSGPALSQERASSQAVSVVVDQPAVSPFGNVNPVGNTDLKAVTGQGDLAQVVNAQNKGVVSGNTVVGASQTGTIHFDNGSFQNLNGLSLLSANTGNNVSINSSLNVNVAISTR